MSETKHRVPCPRCGLQPEEEVFQSHDGSVRFARVLCKRTRNYSWHLVSVAFVKDGMSDEEGLEVARKAWDKAALERKYGE